MTDNKERDSQGQEPESFVIFMLICAGITIAYSLIHEIYINLNK